MCMYNVRLLGTLDGKKHFAQHRHSFIASTFFAIHIYAFLTFIGFKSLKVNKQ